MTLIEEKREIFLTSSGGNLTFSPLLGPVPGDEREPQG
ncbi:hypothetical protein ACVWZX_002978 [Deinococcus sp. UYEF24]